MNLGSEFDQLGDRVWLNASHQGPLPNRAAAAVAEMVRWKQQPHYLRTPEPFNSVPEGLRANLAQLLGVPSQEVVLANSSSFGLHLVANGLEFAPGDEVIVAANDFPSDILPWLRLRDQGVVVRQVRPAGQVLTDEEVSGAITPRTRVVCLTWVHSLSGQVIDLDAIGHACRAVDALFVVNAAQGVGGIPICAVDHPVDVLTTVGFKYLCGPYGTGCCWLGPRALERVRPTKLYWLSALTADDLAAPELDLEGVEPTGPSRFDVFGTANFFNFAAWDAAVELILETGVHNIYRHNLALAERLVNGLDPQRWQVQDRGPVDRRSSMLFLRPGGRSVDEVFQTLDDARIHVARRAGQLRVAPHFYNSNADIDQALEVMNQA